MSLDNWREDFPVETFRTGQDTAMDSITKAFNGGKKYVLAELPTGIGKSMIAIGTAAANDGESYITTSQNLLLDQYESEFSSREDFSVVKGKRNYKCTCYETCEIGEKEECRDMRDSKDKEKPTMTCAYVKAREKTRKSKIAFTNSTYYALAMQNWDKRDMTIVDEAHNIPDDIMNLTQFELTNNYLIRMRLEYVIPPIRNLAPDGLETDKMDAPVVPVDNQKFMDYIHDLKEEITNQILVESGPFGSKDITEKLESLLSKIINYITSVENDVEWVIDYYAKTHKKEAKVVARPLSTSYFASNMFFSQSERFLLQSATIIDKMRFAKDCGIPIGAGQAMFIRRDSPFDLFRRPISIDQTVGVVNQKTMQQALPKISDRIGEILDLRWNQKGLIHTGSYAVQKYLYDRYHDDERCLFLDASNKMEKLNYHLNSDEPTVLFSPSLTEGFDGKGDRLRFQVMCKIPWPDLGDRRIKIKSNSDFGWYQYQAAKTFIQAMGRGMRSNDDWCCNYLLDEGFAKFIHQYKDMPRDITKTIISQDKMPLRF